MATSPIRKQNTPYMVVTPEDIRLLNKLNSSIRFRDEYNMVRSSGGISPSISSVESNCSVSQKDTCHLSETTTTFDNSIYENLENTSNTFTTTLQHLKPALSKKQTINSKVAKKLEFETKDARIAYVHNSAIVLRIVLLFISFFLILSLTSYLFCNVCHRCGKLRKGQQHFYLSKMHIQATSKQSLEMIGVIACDNASHPMHVKLYNVTLVQSCEHPNLDLERNLKAL